MWEDIHDHRCPRFTVANERATTSSAVHRKAPSSSPSAPYMATAGVATMAPNAAAHGSYTASKAPTHARRNSEAAAVVNPHAAAAGTRQTPAGATARGAHGGHRDVPAQLQSGPTPAARWRAVSFWLQRARAGRGPHTSARAPLAAPGEMAPAPGPRAPKIVSRCGSRPPAGRP